jgi:hypothetical protein
LATSIRRPPDGWIYSPVPVAAEAGAGSTPNTTPVTVPRWGSRSFTVRFRGHQKGIPFTLGKSNGVVSSALMPSHTGRIIYSFIFKYLLFLTLILIFIIRLTKKIKIIYKNKYITLTFLIK